MQRFYVNKNGVTEGLITITGDDAMHISKVLRLGAGDELIVCDGEGNDYFCQIENALKTEVTLKIIKTQQNNTEPPIEITLYQAIPKSDKMEYIIQKCVELGVTFVVPVESKYCVAKLKDDKKLVRWQKIADEASKQCGRGRKTVIHPPVAFKDAVKNIPDGSLKIIPYENEKENKLKNTLKNSKLSKISVFIGPEGGFSEEEIALAKENGIIPVTLGPRILRTETAPIAVISACMYELGDW